MKLPVRRIYPAEMAKGGLMAWSSETVSQRQPKRRWRRMVTAFLFLVALIVTARAMLPGFVRGYVNRTLDRSPLYAGSVGNIQIHLWRGAYSIEDIRIDKTTGNIPVPLFAAKRVDFAVEWNALFHGKVVGRMSMKEPELNFVDSSTEGGTQTGAGGPWLEIIKDLFPFKINRADIRNGSIHLRVFHEKPMDVYLSEVQASIENLGNINDELEPLVSTVRATGLVMDQARFEFKMSLDPFSYRPTFHMATRFLGLDVTRLNDLALNYGKFDFKRGWLDFVVEVDAKEGQLVGYAKPLFRNIEVFALAEDVRDGNPVKFLWQAVVGATTSVFKNPSRDQFGTLIPFSGDLTGATTTDMLATIANILRNAFVRAYLPGLEGIEDFDDDIQFETADFDDTLAIGLFP